MIRTSITIGGRRISDHDLTSLTLDQQIGGHHYFEIRLRHDAAKGELKDRAGAWVGETITFGFDHHADVRLDAIPVEDSFKGLVTSIALSRKMATSDLVIKGHSPTIVMEDAPTTQSFTDTGLQEIVDKVLSPYSEAFPEKLTISPRYRRSIDYTVQYKENAFNFVKRLSNKYGEWFYYDGLKFFFGTPTDRKEVNLGFNDQGLNYFDLSLEANPLQLEFEAYDYRQNSAIKKSIPTSSSTSEFGKQMINKSKKIFSNKGILHNQTDTVVGELDQIAERSGAAAIEKNVVLTGVCTNCYLSPGTLVNLQDKDLGENFGTYVITRISHSIGQGGDYTNNFTAVPAENKIPPTTGTSEPPFCETQLGKVVECDDPEATGRVKVALLWQSKTGGSTPWIRVASPYTGKDKGFYIIPEVGDTVLVSFEDSNPDKPYVLTGMYDGENKPEFFDPKNKLKGFKSNGQNKWTFDDDEKSISITAPKKLDLHAGELINLRTDGKSKSEINLDAGEGTVTIKAGKIKIESTQKIELESTEISSKAKSKIVQDAAVISSKAKAKLESSGATVDLKGSAVIMIKGGLVKIN